MEKRENPLLQIVADIDEVFGVGFARQHPSLVIAMLRHGSWQNWPGQWTIGEVVVDDPPATAKEFIEREGPLVP